MSKITTTKKVLIGLGIGAVTVGGGVGGQMFTSDSEPPQYTIITQPAVIIEKATTAFKIQEAESNHAKFKVELDKLVDEDNPDNAKEIQARQNVLNNLQKNIEKWKTD